MPSSTDIAGTRIRCAPISALRVVEDVAVETVSSQVLLVLVGLHYELGDSRRDFVPVTLHGEYHLGQVLVTRDGRLLLVNFEGEPHRPTYEREAKYSPLKM